MRYEVAQALATQLRASGWGVQVIALAGGGMFRVQVDGPYDGPSHSEGHS